jgi:hypothetical protein
MPLTGLPFHGVLSEFIVAKPDRGCVPDSVDDTVPGAVGSDRKRGVLTPGTELACNTFAPVR